MKKIIYSLLFSFLLSMQMSYGQTATWADDIAPILYKKCTGCHHPGGIGHHSFLTYPDLLGWSGLIQNAVNTGMMPPWPPDPSYRHLAFERVLTPVELATINNWVNNGTPQGNPNNAPPAPVYTGAATLTNPDTVYQIPTYTVNTSTDLYRNFVIPSSLIADKYITGYEVLPGNPHIVHHVIVWEDTSGIPAQLDAADPDPGYTNFGGSGSNSSNMIGLWVPGSSPSFWPQGMGQKLPAGTDIVIQVHYPGGTNNEVDSTMILLKTSNTPLRNIFTAPILNHSTSLTNGPLFIPANTTKTFYGQFQLPILFNLSFLTVGPHMHLLGQSILSYGVTLANDTIPFIRINQWDFHWQGLYPFRQVMKIPGGTTLYSEAYYDNTINNFNNPNFPPQDVSLGEATTDEMMLIYFSFTSYVSGDENIIIDSAAVTGVYDPAYEDIISTLQFYDPSPNPSNNQMTLTFYLPKEDYLAINIYDLKGSVVRKDAIAKKYPAGLSNMLLHIDELASGKYIIEMNSGGVSRTKKFIKD